MQVYHGFLLKLKFLKKIARVVGLMSKFMEGIGNRVRIAKLRLKTDLFGKLD